MLQLLWETIIGCDIQPRTYDVTVPTGFDSGPYVTLNSLPDTVRSSQIAAFAMIQRYVFKEIK